jgi:topoisomerase-4 subunit A
VHYFSANANGEAEVVKISLSPNCTARIKELDFYFEELEIKGRGSIGNQVTKYPIRTIKFKEAGKSTLSAKKLWFDDKFGRLNTEEKGTYLGMFDAEDRILVLYHDGNYEITDQELMQRFESEKILLIEKYYADKVANDPFAHPTYKMQVADTYVRLGQKEAGINLAKRILLTSPNYPNYQWALANILESNSF